MFFQFVLFTMLCTNLQIILGVNSNSNLQISGCFCLSVEADFVLVGRLSLSTSSFDRLAVLPLLTSLCSRSPGLDNVREHKVT